MGKEAVFATMGTGQGMGELVFFAHGLQPAAVYARDPTQLLRIPFARLSQVLAERPDLARLASRNAWPFVAQHLRRLALDLHHRCL